MELFKPGYNQQDKVNGFPPVKVEGDGDYYVLQLATEIKSKQVPEQISVNLGLVYCYVKGDQYLMVGSLPSLWTNDISFFLRKRDASNAWVDDPDAIAKNEKDGKNFKENQGRYIAFVNGHPSLEAFVRFHSGSWCIANFTLKNKNAEAMNTFLTSAQKEEATEEQYNAVMSGDYSIVTTWDEVPKPKFGKPKVPGMIDPDTNEVVNIEWVKENGLTMPAVIAHGALPVIKAYGSKKVSPSEKYKENLDLITQKLGVKDFDALVELSLTQPVRVMHVYSLAGLSWTVTPELIDLEISNYAKYIEEKVKPEASEE